MTASTVAGVAVRIHGAGVRGGGNMYSSRAKKGEQASVGSESFNRQVEEDTGGRSTRIDGPRKSKWMTKIPGCHQVCCAFLLGKPLGLVGSWKNGRAC
jgi:hypothetical protein